MQALIADKFDPDKVDALLRTRRGPPKWLTPLIADRAGRELIYTLSARYKNCQLLKYAMQRILMAGHDDEVASVGSRLAGYFEVFHNLMVKRLEEMLHGDDARMQVLSRELMVRAVGLSSRLHMLYLCILDDSCVLFGRVTLCVENHSHSPLQSPDGCVA